MKPLLVILPLAHAVCFAATPPEIAPLAAKYKADTEAMEADRASSFARLAKVYQSALDDAEKTATATGAIKPLVAITEERDGLKAGQLPKTPHPDLPKTLLPAQKAYLAGVGKVEAEIGPRKQRAVADYLRSLTALQSRSAGNAGLLAGIAAEKESIIRDIPVEALEITKRLTGTTWRWSGDKETVTFLGRGKVRWSLGGKEFTWNVTDAAGRKIEGVNGKGNPYTLVLEPAMDAGHLVEKGGSTRQIQMLPQARK